ncbi:uncharacterized protein K441DRAFT_555872, partial [Cenococcum geophilum 1.58]|uniref:uncharacterized protein n=1 Tax=Cenococcum geophilum 1.58 TaxID=794803 RepID=UPI00358DEE58
MSISATVGAAQLLQFGVSLSDVALLLNIGRKIGNWFRVSSNDQELLGSIGEDPEAILKRRGLIEVSYMERKWAGLDFIYEGSCRRNSQTQAKETAAGLSPLSWLMITITTALDFCLPHNSIRALIRRVYVRVLDRDEELEDSLRVLLPTNVESWRSAGSAQQIAYPRNNPSSMIQAIPADRRTINKMTYYWGLGAEAASKMYLQVTQAKLPFYKEAEIYYALENNDVETSNFTKDVVMLAGRAFPDTSEDILLAVEKITE